MAKDHDAYVAAASERYQSTYARVDRLVRSSFKRVKPVIQYDMPTWLVPRPKGAPMPEREGTLPSDHIYIGLADRKGGVTLNIWYPGDYYLFDRHEAQLKAAGLKVMRGCLAYNRKTGEYPVDALEPLIADIKARDGM